MATFRDLLQGNLVEINITTQEYVNKDSEPIKNKHSFYSSKDYINFSMTPQEKTKYMRLMFDVNASEKSRVILTEQMFALGEPRTYFASNSETYNFDLAERERLGDSIDDIDNKTDANIETTQENSAAIQINSNSIANEVSERVMQGELIVEQTSSLVQQTVDSFDVIFNKIEADQSLTNDEVELIQSYFRINENGVIIGKSDSAIEFFAENNRVGFRENGNDIAYWEEGTMHVDRLIAVTTIMVGYHLIEKYDSPVAGNTTIVRLGD